jgi:hypothetical protein
MVRLEALEGVKKRTKGRGYDIALELEPRAV